MLSARDQQFLAELETYSRTCIGAQVSRTPHSVCVKASDATGFDMTAAVRGGRYALMFDGWCEELESANEARGLFQAALCGQARLRVETLGGRRWRWTLERPVAAGIWVPASTISHVTWHFWRRRGTRYLRNAFVVEQVRLGGSRIAKAG